MATRSRVGRKSLFTNKQLAIALLIALILQFLPLGILGTLGKIVVLVVAVLLLLK